MVFSRNSEQVWTVEERPVRGMEMIQSLDWSPDGKTLVACVRSKGRSGLWTWSSPTANPVLLWADSLEKYDVRFVPGSQSLVYVAKLPYGLEAQDRSGSKGGWNGLFRLDRAIGSRPQVLLGVDTETISSPLPLGGGTLIWLSDRTGYLIRYRGTWEGTNLVGSPMAPTATSLRWHEGGALSTGLLMGPDPSPNALVLALRDKVDTARWVPGLLKVDELPVTAWRRQERERLQGEGGGFRLALDEVRPANLGLLGPVREVGEEARPLLPDHTGGDWLPGFEPNTIARIASTLFAAKPKTTSTVLKSSPYVKASSIDHVSLQAGSTLLQGRMPLLSASRMHTLHARPGAVVRVGLSDLPEDRNLSAGVMILQSLSDFQSYLQIGRAHV